MISAFIVRLGVDPYHVYVWSRTRKGGWAIAQSLILGTTITLERLRKRGYESMLDHYLKVSPQFNEPRYTRPGLQLCGEHSCPRLQMVMPFTRLCAVFHNLTNVKIALANSAGAS